MRTIKQITDYRFLNIKEVNDPKMGCKGYQFAERKGVDSVAFICVNKDANKFLVNSEATPPLGEFLLRAFGGSLDKETSHEKIVQGEVREEAGYDVELSDINLVGKSFVSTQMNQYCYLYLVFISEKQKTERKPENSTEALSSPKWLTEEEITKGDDWKSIAIIYKAKTLGLLN
jgi:hypothetical protein